MSLKNITAKTGKAEIQNLGQTQADRFGRNPHTQVKGSSKVTKSSTK